MKTTIAGIQFNRHLVFQRTGKRLFFNLPLTFNGDESPFVTPRNKPQTTVFYCRVIQCRPATHETMGYLLRHRTRIGILVIILARSVRGRFHKQLIVE